MLFPSAAGESDNLNKAISMNASAISKTPGSSGPDRVVTGFRQATAQALLIGLLVILAVGCSGGRGESQTPVAESPKPEATAVAEALTPTAGLTQSVAPSPDDDQVPDVVFPQHDAPLGTDNGGHYFAGRLVLDNGCLRAKTTRDINSPGVSMLPIWPAGTAISVEGEAVGIVDKDGEIAAAAGDYIRVSRATISYQEAQDKGLLRGMSEHCEGPFLLVGDEVSVFDPDNEPGELRLTDPDVVFPRRKTLTTSRGYPEALGIGELVLEGQCLRLGRGDKHGYTIIWPAGFTPHVERGVVQVRNGAGRVNAQIGDRIAGGGGYSSSGYGDCPGGTFGIHSIKVLPDVEVYFPTQDGTLSKGSWMQDFIGKLVLQGRCLVIDEAVRVYDRVTAPGDENLLIWPDNFTLSLDEDVPEIVDPSGRVVARVGDEIQVSAVAVNREEAVEHSGYREVSPDCGGGLWFVGEDIATAPDSESP